MSTNLAAYLQAEFARRKKKNTRYSVRGFARDLSMDATALSRILAGSRPIGAKTAANILSRLKIEPSLKDVLLRSLVAPAEYGVPTDQDFVELTSKQVEQMD